MWQANDYPITIAQTKGFENQASQIFTPEELIDFINHLAYNPDEGMVIPGTGGIRKIRWAAKNKGKSHAARVIYYFRDLNMPLYLLTIYSKGEKIDLTASEKKKMERYVDEIVQEHSRRWLRIVDEQLGA